MDVLFPYMSDHWRGYLHENGFKIPPAVAFTYPPWSSAFGTPASETTLEQIRGSVLQRASHAVLNCYFGVETQRNPYMAAELATAVNLWLRDTFLESEDRLLGSLVLALHDT